MSYNKNVWDRAFSILENNFGSRGQMNIFNAYLKPLIPETELNGTLYLRAPGEAQQSMIEDRFRAELESALLRATLELTGSAEETKVCIYSPLQMNSFLASVRSDIKSTSSITLNPRYTFDSFIVGNSNKVAYSTSRNVSEHPGMAFNPLFIYGDVGLGKTHLMHAIGNQLLSINPQTKILYITSESFISEFVDSLRNKSQDSFKKKFRSVDVLMIDDVQFIAKGDTSQEELFHTFNSLWQNNKQLIFTSDRTPQSIPKLEDRLCSRFMSGVVIQIAKPDYETRVAILRDKVGYIGEQMGYYADVDDDVLYYIAGKEDTNIRELEGALKSLFAHAQLFSKEGEEHPRISMDIASEALSSFVTKPREKVITPDLIINSVCTYYDVTIDDFKSKKKNKEIAYPRQVAMYLLHSMCSMKYEKIAEVTGRKDHTTVLYAVKKIGDMVKADTNVKNTIEDIKHKIRE